MLRVLSCGPEFNSTGPTRVRPLQDQTVTEYESTPSELQTRYGKLQVPDDQHDLIGRFLRTYGEWAPYEVRFVAGAIAPGARVADIGAFIGTFGLGIMTYQLISSVCFVEANPAIAPLLRRNVMRNAKVSCVVVEAVVVPSAMLGSVVGSVEAGNAGSFSVNYLPADERISADVSDQQFTLGEICRQHGPFDLIKLDVEGLENSLLRDEIDFVSSGSTKFWMECNESAASIGLCQTLLDAGLDVYYCAFPVVALDNYNESRETILPWAYESGLWATRGEAPTMPPPLLAAGCIIRRVKGTDELRRAMWHTPRWSPTSWTGQDMPAVVALACHTILGERFEDYIGDADARPRPASWAKPLPVLYENRITSLLDQLAQSQSGLRAAEIMLFAEREWMAAFTERANSELERDRAQLDHDRAQLDQERSQLDGDRSQLDGDRSQVAAFEASTTYRIVRKLAQIARAYPLVGRIARPCARAMGRLLRHV